jgi:hypothetical protein
MHLGWSQEVDCCVRNQMYSPSYAAPAEACHQNHESPHIKLCWSSIDIDIITAYLIKVQLNIALQLMRG